MSFITMAKSLIGEIPGVPLSLAKNKLNEALGLIYDETSWSFQTEYSGWLAPGLLASAGTFTVTPGQATVIGDATATAAIAAIPSLFPIKTLQFRDPSYALYNIIDSDTTSNAPFVTLTLDRVWSEPTSGAGHAYQIYQAYFPVPVADFRTFCEIRDTTFQHDVVFWELSQDDLSRMDPKRVMFGPRIPTHAVPWGVDKRTGSTTLGRMLYELWPHVLSQVPYSFSYDRRGPALSANTDTVPYPVTEECLTWRAKEVLYQFKEAQRGENMQRGSGSDWRFLAQAAAAEYKQVLKAVRRIDANLHRKFVTRPRPTGSQASRDGYSVQRTGQLNIGSFDR